jgi:hypothetical protein
MPHPLFRLLGIPLFFSPDDLQDRVLNISAEMHTDRHAKCPLYSYVPAMKLLDSFLPYSTTQSLLRTCVMSGYSRGVIQT